MALQSMADREQASVAKAIADLLEIRDRLPEDKRPALDRTVKRLQDDADA